ncbi:MAG: fibronectin type III domain-containing protein, partial [Oscillospiraceae bacterium]|nr:fibronectin type III domain-containing protein [Oscillospiraceae bacterium]
MNTKTEKNRRFFAAAAAILAAALLLGLLPLLGAGAHAETSGVYTYEVADGKATITRCDTAVSGALTIPAKLGGYPVTAIGDEAFWQCYDLTKVTIPSGVTEIGTAAFGRCNALTEVVLPAGLVRLGTRAFFDCYSLTAITLPESLKIIEDGAFRACTALTALAIPKNVEAIGMGAFWSCIALNDLTVDPANGEFVMQDGVLYDKAKTTLVAAPAAASVSIPSTVTTIQDFAFAGNYAMTSVTIPASVTKVAYGQFEDCVNLTSVSLPAGTTEIGDYSFYGCEALRQIAIPAGVTYIGFCSFQLSGLTDVTIPASVFVLNTDAFKLCPDLKTVRIAKGVDTIGHEVFGWCPALTEIWCGAAEKPLNWCDDWLGENDPAPTVHWGELAPPSNVTAKPVAAGGIKVSWTLSEGATKYNVYRKVSGGSWENIGYSRTNSYTDTTAEAGTLYYYRVRAQVSKTTSAYSANASARWLEAPAAPTLTNYTSGIKATWGEVTGATIYYVWRAEGDGAF